jgi:hypothetical protein
MVGISVASRSQTSSDYDLRLVTLQADSGAEKSGKHLIQHKYASARYVRRTSLALALSGLAAVLVAGWISRDRPG